MGIMHGLAAILIIFGGIVIQCECRSEETSLNTIQDPLLGEGLLALPHDLLDAIIGKTDLKTFKEILRLKITKESNIVMRELLKSRTVWINPGFHRGETKEIILNGGLVLLFGKHETLVSFLEKFGSHVKKLYICYVNMPRHQRHELSQNFIETFARNLDELHLLSDYEEDLWESFSNDIIFPEVKTFHFQGKISRDKFKLISKFPKLESVRLGGRISDVNFMAGLTTLKKLNFDTYFIREQLLIPIFANNKNMKKIFIQNPKEVDTIKSIAKNLMKLETLKVKNPDKNFLFRTNDQELFNLSSVTELIIRATNMVNFFENCTFIMPNLKMLRIIVLETDNRIIGFIEHFEQLESVDLTMTSYIEPEPNYYQPKLLEKLVEHFDRNSNLQSLKSLCINGLKYELGRQI